MRTKLPAWLTLLLSGAATTFICETLPAQNEYRGLAAQRDPVLGNGGGGNNNGGGQNVFSETSGLIAGLFSSVFPSAEKREQAATAQNQQGILAENRGDKAAADIYFKKALKYSPNNPTIQQNLACNQCREGTEAFNSGDYEAALNFYTQALANFPAADSNNTNIREEDRQTISRSLAWVKGQIQQQLDEKLRASRQREENQRAEALRAEQQKAEKLRAEQQRIQDQQARFTEANDARTKGNAAAKAGDYAQAVEYYKAMIKDPSFDNDQNRKIIADIESYLKAVQDRAAQEARVKVEQQTAVRNIHQSVETFAQTLNTPPASGGLDFVDSSTPLRDAVGDKPSDQNVAPGSMGYRVAKPGDLPKDPKPASTGHNNAQQALEALNDVGAAYGKKQQIIDTAGAQGKDITAVNIPTPASSSSEMPRIPQGMEKDDVIQEGVTRFNTWLPKLQQARADVIKAQADVAQATAPEARKTAQDALTQAQIKSEGSQQMVDSAKDQIVKRTVYLKPFVVSGAAPPSAADPLKTKP